MMWAVSIDVALTALTTRIQEFGPVAYLVSIGVEGLPHVVSVRVGLEGIDLVCGAGRQTLANLERRADVTLLWPAPPGDGYCLIVDGKAHPRPDSEEPSVGIEPTAAVLHRTPEGDPSAPSCITVLPRS